MGFREEYLQRCWKGRRMWAGKKTHTGDWYVTGDPPELKLVGEGEVGGGCEAALGVHWQSDEPDDLRFMRKPPL